MAYSPKLRLNLPTFSSTPTRIVPLSSLQSHKRVFCSFPSRQYSGEHDNQENDEKEDSNHCRLSKCQLDASRTLLVERYDNGTVKRYILDSESWVQIVLEEHGYAARGLQMQEATTNVKLSWVPQIVKDFILPAGFPESVSEDYFEYMLLQFPTNLTAWICHTLVTSSLLKAVGVGSFSGTTAAASAAAVRWVSKDGLGAIGRLFIGGRFGNLFDNDPKQWRMYADFVGSAGSIFELTTQLYPAYFLPLASLGNLTKAVARGLKDPSFRVIQNHFANSGNLGEVAAKEEVWEVAAQLLGLALGILVMGIPGLLNSYPMLVFTWLSMRGLHLWLRYQSLSVLRFNTINLKRARALAKSHVLYSTVPGYAACNKEESILTWERFLKPRIFFGLSFEEIIGGKVSSSVVEDLLKLYSKERHILVLSRTQQLREVEIFVSFKVEATSITVLRSLWQAYWLYEHWRGRDHIIVQLKESLLEMEGRFDDFLQQLNGAGWDTNKINLKVPNEFVIETPAPLSFDSDQ